MRIKNKFSIFVGDKSHTVYKKQLLLLIMSASFTKVMLILETEKRGENKKSIKMTIKITAPKKLDTTIPLPASKSISNRALVIHALSGGNVTPLNLSDCDDTRVMGLALRDNPSTVDIGGAGTAMRFLTAYYAATSGEHVITGTKRMKERPIAILVDALRYLGADIEYLGDEGFPPLRIRGRELDGGYIEMPANVSSQYISALLMIGPMLKHGIELKMTGDIVSRPYIDLTLWMMRVFGAEADWTEVDTVTVSHKPYEPHTYLIESDWSSASYWYEMLALSSDRDSSVKLEGLMDGSKQGDSVVKYIFSLLGVRTLFAERDGDGPTTVTLKKTIARLPRLDYDFVSSPDLVQTVVVCCALMDIPFRFTGLSSLRIKETDRIAALKREMMKLGYAIADEGTDVLSWDGLHSMPTGEPLDTYEDQRMAMSLAPAAMKFGSVTMNNPHVVTKSYPSFWDDMRRAGFVIEEV